MRLNFILFHMLKFNFIEFKFFSKVQFIIKLTWKVYQKRNKCVEVAWFDIYSKKKIKYFFSRFFFKITYEFQSSKTFLFRSRNDWKFIFKVSYFLQRKIGIFFHNSDENSNEDIIILLFLSIEKFYCWLRYYSSYSLGLKNFLPKDFEKFFLTTLFDA